MTVSFTTDDEGKEVVDASGDTLGIVTEIDRDTAYVDPDPGLTKTVLADLGWGDADGEEYTVEADAVDTKANEKLHLRGDL